MSFWSQPNARVLVVSTEQSVRQSLATALTCSGYACDTAHDGDHAFEQMAHQPPVITVVDMRDADEDHLFFVALLRKRFPEVGVIRLLEGRAIIDSGKAGHEMRFDSEHALPSEDQLQRAVEWVLAERSLRTLSPRVGQA